MTNENLDDILLDGELIADIVNNSSQLARLINHSSDFEEKNIFINRLSSIWKDLVDFNNKYPNSEYVARAKDQTLKDAKIILSEAIYNQIYG